MSPKFLYQDSFIPELTVSNFGVLTTLRLDAQQLLFDKNEEPPNEPAMNPALTPPSPSVPAPREYNVMDIDFDALAQAESDSILSAAHA